MRLIDTLSEHARLRGESIAAQDESSSRSWTGLVDRVARAAAGLTALGLKPGDRAGILAMNGVRYFEAQLALWWAGAVVVPMNIRWSPQESLYAVRDCGMALLLADHAFAAHARDVADAVQTCRLIDLAGDGSAQPDFETLATGAVSAELHRGQADALAGIYYTGGTTGFPKGVMLTHQALRAAAELIALATLVGPESRVLHAAPMFHLADGAIGHAALLAGATNVYLPRFDAARTLDAIEAHGVTEMVLVPTMIAMLLDDPGYGAHRLRSLRTLLFGASPIAEALLARVRADLPDLRLVHCYGQTEMGPPVSFLDPDYQVPGGARSQSVGKPFPRTEVIIVDEAGTRTAPNQPGELLARGPTMMQGYWNRPEETAGTIVDGWVRTGDVAYQDEEGFIYICDRTKDMIITGGENVFSAEVENAIASHPAVSQVAVIGVPDEHYGERVHAVLVLREGQSLSLDELIVHCRSLIASYKNPRSLETRAELPISSTGKVLKRALRDPYWLDRGRGVN